MKNFIRELLAVMAIIGAGLVLLLVPANACESDNGPYRVDEYATDTYVDDMYTDSIQVTEAGVVSAHAVQAIYNSYEDNWEVTEPCEPSTTYYMHKCDGQNTIVEYYSGQPTQYANVSEDYTETYDYQSFEWAETEIGTFAIN